MFHQNKTDHSRCVHIFYYLVLDIMIKKNYFFRNGYIRVCLDNDSTSIN